MRSSQALALITMAILCGCSTVVVQRTTDIATAGKAYVSTLKEANVVAVNKVVDFAIEETAVNPVAREGSDLSKAIARSRDRFAEVEKVNAYLTQMGQYFEGLDALAKADQSKALSDDLGKLLVALEKEPFELKITTERATAIQGLSAYVAKQAHADIVRRHLEQAAEPVARAIDWAGRAAETVRSSASNVEKNLRLDEYNNKVKLPFTSKLALDADWKALMLKHIREPELDVVKNGVRRATTDMLTAWRRVLSAEYDYDEILATLKEVKAGIAAVKNLQISTQ